MQHLLYGVLQVVAFKSSLVIGTKCKMGTKSSRKVLVIVDVLLEQGCKTFWLEVTWATKFCMVATDICGSSEWNLFHVTLLAPIILSWLLGFGKYVHPCNRKASTKKKRIQQ
jgi:hypothetical protein